MNVVILAIAIVSVSLNALAQVALRKTMLAVGALPSSAAGLVGFAASIGLNAWFIAGMTCYAVSIALWMLVLSKTEVSLAYPLLSIGYIIAAVIGYYYLGEAVTITRLAGIALICGGIVVIAQSA